MPNNLLNFNPQEHKSQLVSILTKLSQSPPQSDKQLFKILRQHPKPNGNLFSKSELIAGFRYLSPPLDLNINAQDLLNLLRKKPIRTLSGVATVSVLTKPFPCPGKCIFCPNDVKMPKSYLSDEPGAQRATRNFFDPYLQTYNRLLALDENGHAISKIELIILGGTWSYYPVEYQTWFITRCFQALNDYSLGADHRSQVKKGSDFTHLNQLVSGLNLTTTYNQIVSKELVNQARSLLYSWEKATLTQLHQVQHQNQSSKCRNVGLVIETRPDTITRQEVIHLRALGCTKVQIGFQSLNNQVLTLNKRGHSVTATRRAVSLLRQAGFKILAHWMPNLYGSTPKQDIKDFNLIFSDPAFRPDELKIYPTSLIESAELMNYYAKQLWQPYSETQLADILAHCLTHTPRYTRLSRVIRDIPSTDIVVGNKKTNFREIVTKKLAATNQPLNDIRAREIKALNPTSSQLITKSTTYKTTVSKEYFLEFTTPTDNLLGFLRLSLPTRKSFISEISSSAIIREIHVYGLVSDVGSNTKSSVQHRGLGRKLIKRAIAIARRHRYPKLSVISAVGTREYYQSLGFRSGKLYQHLNLSNKGSIITTNSVV